MGLDPINEANVERLKSNPGETAADFAANLLVNQWGYHVDEKSILIKTSSSTYELVPVDSKVLEIILANSVEEAPIDGNKYSRQGAGWVVADSSFTISVEGSDFTVQNSTIHLVATSTVDITATFPDAENTAFQARVYKTTSIDTPDVTGITAGGQNIGGVPTQVISGESEGFYAVANIDRYDIIQDNRGGVSRKLSQSTTIIDGFIVTIAGANTVDISEGSYTIEDSTNTKKPVSLFKRYPGQTAYPITGVNTKGYTSLYVDSAGAVQQLLNQLPTPESQITAPRFCVVTHVRGAGSIDGVSPWWTTGINPSSRLNSYMEFVGFVKRGLSLSASTGNNLQIQHGSGAIQGPGLEANSNSLRPDIQDANATDPASPILYLKRDEILTLETDIDVTNYDLGGVITPIGGGADDCAITRVYYLLNGGISAQYGQNTYGSQQLAIEALSDGLDSFTENPTLNGVSILIGYIIAERTATNLADAGQATFIQSDRFGDTGGSAGGGTVTPTWDQTLTQGPTATRTAEIDATSITTDPDAFRVLLNSIVRFAVTNNGDLLSFEGGIDNLGTNTFINIDLAEFFGKMKAGFEVPDTDATATLRAPATEGGFLFATTTSPSNTEGLYEENGIGGDNGDPKYEFTYDPGGVNQLYVCYSANVTGAGTYWFIDTQIRTGDDAFTLANYRTSSFTVPSPGGPGSLPDDIAYVGVSEPGNPGGMTDVSGAPAPALNADWVEIEDKITVPEPLSPTEAARKQDLYWQTLYEGPVVDFDNMPLGQATIDGESGQLQKNQLSGMFRITSTLSAGGGAFLVFSVKSSLTTVGMDVTSSQPDPIVILQYGYNDINGSVLDIGFIRDNTGTPDANKAILSIGYLYGATDIKIEAANLSNFTSFAGQTPTEIGLTTFDAFYKNAHELKKVSSDGGYAKDLSVDNLITDRSPFYYGAVGGGVIDDATAVQDCVNANKVTILDGFFAVGTKITVPSGHKVISSNNFEYGLKRLGQTTVLECTDQTSIEGVLFDENSSVLDPTSDYPIVWVKRSASRNDGSFGKISGCNFRDGNSWGIYVDNYCYDVSGELRDDFAIENNQFYNIANAAICIYNSTYLSITNNNDFRYCHTGILGNGAANLLVSDNTALKVGNTVYTNYFFGADLGGDGAFMVQLSTVDGNNSGKWDVKDNIANHLRGRFFEAYQVAALSGVEIPNQIQGNILLSYSDDLNGNAIPEKIRLFGSAKAAVKNNLIEGQMSQDIYATQSGAFTPALHVTNNTWAVNAATVVATGFTPINRDNDLI